MSCTGYSYLPVDFRAVSESFSKSGKKALMTLIRNNDAWDKSNVIFDKGVIKEYNKKISLPGMEYIDYGLGIIGKSCFGALKENEACDLADIYRGLVSENELAGYEVKERFYEIGSFKGIEETKKFLKKRR